MSEPWFPTALEPWQKRALGLCEACKSPLACSFRQDVQPGYCLIAKRDAEAANSHPRPDERNLA